MNKRLTSIIASAIILLGSLGCNTCEDRYKSFVKYHENQMKLKEEKKEKYNREFMKEYKSYDNESGMINFNRFIINGKK